MIPSKEIKSKAREYGVPESSIERDYAQNWLLWALSGDFLVLKGGTGIRKVYFGDYRFSDDLDFTLYKAISENEIRDFIEKAVLKAGEESGISFFKDIRLKINDNGFECDVFFQILQKGENRTKIKIDITTSEHEKIFLPVKFKEIIHPYSDELKGEIKVYALEEIMAEKIRSLFQRTRPRDLYDVWFLFDRVNWQEVVKILPEKFAFKKVSADFKDLFARKSDFKNAWENSLGHQLQKLPDFNTVFDTVLQNLQNAF